MIKGQGD